jgi:hypothetical protein
MNNHKEEKNATMQNRLRDYLKPLAGGAVIAVAYRTRVYRGAAG